jgi:hypothetical protein
LMTASSKRDPAPCQQLEHEPQISIRDQRTPECLAENQNPLFPIML